MFSFIFFYFLLLVFSFVFLVSIWVSKPQISLHIGIGHTSVTQLDDTPCHGKVCSLALFSGDYYLEIRGSYDNVIEHWIVNVNSKSQCWFWVIVLWYSDVVKKGHEIVVWPYEVKELTFKSARCLTHRDEYEIP